jgi:hypothetical protein
VQRRITTTTIYIYIIIICVGEGWGLLRYVCGPELSRCCDSDTILKTVSMASDFSEFCPQTVVKMIITLGSVGTLRSIYCGITLLVKVYLHGQNEV